MLIPIPIRPVVLADASSIAVLSGQLGYPAEEQRMAGRLQDLLKRLDHRVLAAVGDGGRLTGWVHVYLRRLVMQDLHAELGGLIVADHVRGEGIGVALLAAAEAWAEARRAGFMIVRSNQIREEAHQFYLRSGYKLVKQSLVFHKDLG